MCDAGVVLPIEVLESLLALDKRRLEELADMAIKAGKESDKVKYKAQAEYAEMLRCMLENYFEGEE